MVHTCPDEFIPLADAFKQVVQASKLCAAALQSIDATAPAAEVVPAAETAPTAEAAPTAGTVPAAGKPVADNQGSSELPPDPLPRREPNSFEKYDQAVRQIERSIREALDGDVLLQFIRTSNGIELLIDREGWCQESFGIPGLENIPNPLTSPGPDTGGQPVLLRKRDFQKWLLTQQAQVAPAPGSRRGTTMKYDWPDARDYAFKLLDEQGEFREWDSAGDWRSKSGLERKVLSYMEKATGEGKGPAESTIRAKVSEWLTEWRTKANKEGTQSQ